VDDGAGDNTGQGAFIVLKKSSTKISFWSFAMMDDIIRNF
jgi:hypothetical protein